MKLYAYEDAQTNKRIVETNLKIQNANMLERYDCMQAKLKFSLNQNNVHQEPNQLKFTGNNINSFITRSN